MELRCVNGNLFGIVDEGSGKLDVACSNRRCGKSAGVVVIHRFDLATAKVVKTKKYKDPAQLFSQKGRNNASDRDATPLRSA